MEEALAINLALAAILMIMLMFIAPAAFGALVLIGSLMALLLALL